MMTKLNASTSETWRYYLARGTWRLIYDPDFVSAKNRNKKGLRIIDERDETIALVIDGDDRELWRTTLVDRQDAWQCCVEDLMQWASSLDENDELTHWHNPDVMKVIRQGVSSESERVK